jgi:hypothetical protein
MPLVASKLLRIGEHALPFDRDAAELFDRTLRTTRCRLLKDLRLDRLRGRVTRCSPLGVIHPFPLEWFALDRE